MAKGIKAWWRRVFGKDVKAFSNDQVVEAYVNAGAQFGSVVSYIYMGECVGFEKLLDQWEVAEKAYADLGYRTLSIDDFVDHGGYGKDIDAMIRQPRKEGEKPVYHAAYYREHFLGKVGMCDVMQRALQGEVTVGQYQVPSTEHLKEH